MARKTASPKVHHGGLSLKSASKDWRFWLLAYAFIPISFAVGGPIPNLETILGNKGFAPGDAVTLASLLGIAVIIGRVVGGYLLDHLFEPCLDEVFVKINGKQHYLWRAVSRAVSALTFSF